MHAFLPARPPRSPAAAAWAALLAAAVLCAPAAAQLSAAARPGPRAGVTALAAPTLRAARVSTPIHLDGRLDEPGWGQAEPARLSVQRSPRPGAAPSERTEARVLYDDAALYVAVRLFDSRPDSIAAQLERRDGGDAYSDWVHVAVDSYHDRRTAFRFSVNPAGVKRDAMHSDDVRESVEWDAVWDVATRVDSAGWTAEFRIPFSQLRFGASAPAGGRVWGLQIQRDIARRQETDTWSPWPPQAPGYVSHFGDLAGLEGIRPVRRAELQPYLSSRLTRAPGSAANPFHRDNDVGLSAGADLKLGLTPGLTLSGTVNPDFGQVEADPAVVNLSAFETFFAERRPFFVEGADAFAFGRTRHLNNAYGQETFFYSRRVGRPPLLAAGGSGVQFVDAPEQSTILGAAKVSGKAGGWTVGVLDALTSEERTRFITSAGEERDLPVSPLTNHLVARVRRDLRQGRTVGGGIVTVLHRDVGDPVLNGLVRSAAYAAGGDFEHGWGRGAWVLSGSFSVSRVEGSREAMAVTGQGSAHYFQRPDAGYLREYAEPGTSLMGSRAELALARTGNWSASVDLKQVTPGFEINDLGYLYRADYRAVGTHAGYQRNTPMGAVRSYSAYLFANHAWNFGGDRIYEGYGAGSYVTFSNLWNAFATVSYSPPTMSDRLTWWGPLARVPGSAQLSFSASTDARKRVMLWTSGSLVRGGDGGFARALGAGIDARPSPAVRFRAGTAARRDRGTRQYVAAVADALATGTYGTRYVFADLDQTTLSLDTRLDWTFTPTLSLQLYAQPFVSAGRYSRLKELQQPRSGGFARYGDEVGTLRRGQCSSATAASTAYAIDPDGTGPAACFQLGDPDFNFRSLRGNAVLRWEFRPASTLFLVWQQRREGSAPLGTFDFDRDAGAIFRQRATNVFLVKATYWIGR